MLIRIVHGKLIEHVCSQCAQDNDLPTENATWSKIGWCCYCGLMSGKGSGGGRHRGSALAQALGLTGTETEGR